MNTLARVRLACGLLLCIIAACVGCSASQANVIEKRLAYYEHPDGLSLCLPSELTIEMTASGFYIYPKTTKNQLRIPLEVMVNLRTEESKPEGRWTRRWFHNPSIWYRIDEEEGGSGGTGYRFTAWREYRNNYVVFEQTMQTEGVTPDFSLAWQVIEYSNEDKRCGPREMPAA